MGAVFSISRYQIDLSESFLTVLDATHVEDRWFGPNP